MITIVSDVNYRDPPFSCSPWILVHVVRIDFHLFCANSLLRQINYGIETIVPWISICFNKNYWVDFIIQLGKNICSETYHPQLGNVNKSSDSSERYGLKFYLRLDWSIFFIEICLSILLTGRSSRTSSFYIWNFARQSFQPLRTSLLPRWNNTPNAF